mmetsp:Transcript_8565/g.16512  ORF Transcript_8565/g.16512 Transcript_8565/m.16512 type:complete len:104 (-) Transcript_8565:76-387(-)
MYGNEASGITLRTPIWGIHKDHIPCHIAQPQRSKHIARFLLELTRLKPRQISLYRSMIRDKILVQPRVAVLNLREPFCVVLNESNPTFCGFDPKRGVIAKSPH